MALMHINFHSDVLNMDTKISVIMPQRMQGIGLAGSGDSENYPVYYDTEVVGEIIEFEARKYDLMNSGDESVLGMIDESTKLYKQTSKLKNKKSGDFTRLEIGEIRQAGSNYYVWVKEVIGDKETELVYSIYPEKQFTMKMAARYKV